MNKKLSHSRLLPYVAGAIITLLPIKSIEANTQIAKAPTLEARVVQLDKSQPISHVLNRYEKRLSSETEQDEDYASKRPRHHAPNKQISPLGSFVYGHFRLDNQEITIGYGPQISEKERTWTEYHESAHAQGILSETKADAYAMSKTGYNPRPLGIRSGLPK